MNNPRFLFKYPDEVRHPLTNDSDEWDEIVDSLLFLERIMGQWEITTDEKKKIEWMNAVRVMFESLYVAGYYRGKKEAG